MITVKKKKEKSGKLIKVKKAEKLREEKNNSTKITKEEKAKKW